MNIHARTTVFPFAVAVLALSGSARALQATQIPPQLAQGMASNYPVGMTISETTSPNPLLIRAPSVNGGVPAPWTPGAFATVSQNNPDYGFTGLTYWAPTGPGILPPTFGGISTGGELMPPVNSAGQLVMGGIVNWYMLSVTVAPGSQGAAGSVMDLQSNGGSRDVSGDIFSYYADGSIGINTALVDTSRLESSREQLKLDQVSPTPMEPRSITNFDYGMGVFSTDSVARAGTMFPFRDRFYFTLTKAYLSQFLPAGLIIDNQVATASTVYVMRWNVSTSPQWSSPVIAFSHADLFDESIVTVDSVEIDALSVDRGSGTWDVPSRAVISLTLASNTPANGTFNQILVYQRGMAKALPLATDPNPIYGGSQLFTDALGVTGHAGDPVNVTGTCGLDPDERYTIGPIVAVPTDLPRTGAGTLGLSAVRGCIHRPPSPSGDETAQDDTLNVQLTGTRYYPHMFGIVRFYTESPAVPIGSTPGPKTQWGDPILVDWQMLQQNCISFQVPVPCELENKQFRFSADLVGIDFNPGLVITQLRDTCVLTILN